jgi:hypothetical protein
MLQLFIALGRRCTRRARLRVDGNNFASYPINVLHDFVHAIEGHLNLGCTAMANFMAVSSRLITLVPAFYLVNKRAVIARGTGGSS